MKKFLIAGTSLAAVAAAGSAGAVDVTLGGSINMGIDFGLGKNNGNLVVGEAFNEVSLSINAAHTTDGGLAFGGGFTMGAATELEFDPYTDGGAKFAARMTVDGRTNIAANLWNVSGGGSVAADNVVSVKINSDWLGIDQEQEAFTLALGSFTSSNICKLAGRGAADGDEIWFGGGPADGGSNADGADSSICLLARHVRTVRSAQDCSASSNRYQYGASVVLPLYHASTTTRRCRADSQQGTV